jgi:hypothetical protein
MADDLLDNARASMAAEFTELTAALSNNTGEPVVQQQLVEFARRGVPGAQHAAVTMIGADGRPRTTAATDDVPQLVDALQYRFEQGPCLEAITGNNIVHAADLRNDRHWPLFAAATVELTVVRSMLSFRLHLTAEHRAALNLYADTPYAFTNRSTATGAIFAAYSSLALRAADSQTRADHLLRALETNREIGIATGILMASRLLTKEQAFDQLRRASQNLNVKLVDIAAAVALTGELPHLPPGH